MDAATWNRVKEIHADALEREPSQRGGFLDSACGSDLDLRRQVESLLAADDEAGDFLSDPPRETADRGSFLRAAMSNDAAEPTEKPGTHVGRYLLGEPIGEGGFGTVYRAEQTEPVRRTVALKVIKPGMDSRRVVARFNAERQALAMMDHPFIAKVLDAGATDSGRPYFVMELVEGAPITTYCDDRRLSLDDRLQLYLDVCAAVQHAHQKGIIHRDLKPSNVLVSGNGASPSPKVIDFGVAKAIEARISEDTLTTDPQIIGTPAYMSPEQAGATPEGVDTRTDVYSLGVLLYELLTGSTPFDSKSLVNAGYGEMIRIIRQEEPARPSTRVSRIRNDSSSVAMVQDPAKGRRDTSSAVGADTFAEVRGSDAVSLRRRLSGDLDWIVMKCLEKDADRRYATAAALADDIQRHLRDEPVAAGPPSTTYRLRKFAKRNRGVVIATICVVLALAAGTVISTIGFVRADRARVRAEEAERSAEAVTQYLSDMLGAVSPSELGRDATLRDILDQQEEVLSEKFAGQPLVEARLRLTIGNTYSALGMFERGEPHLRRAIELREAAFGRDHAKTMQAVQRLAANLRARSLFDQAEPLLREAVEAQERLLGPASRKALTSKFELAVLLRVMKKHDEAESVGREALALCRSALGPKDKLTLELQQNLSALCAVIGRPDEARSLFEETVKLQTEILGPEHPDTLLTRFDLAIRRCADGRHEDAAAMYPDIIAGHERTLGEQHRMTLAVRSYYARELGHLGRFQEADELITPTLSAQREMLGDQHRDVLESLEHAADIKEGLGDKQVSKRLREETLDLYLKYRGPDDTSTLIATVNLAACLFELGEVERSEELHRRALNAYRRILGRANDKTANSALHLVNLLHAGKRYDEESALIKETLRDLRAERDEMDGDVQELLHRRAHMLQATGKLDEAMALYQSTYRAQISAIGDPPRISHYASCLSNALMQQKEFEKAADVYAEWISHIRGDPPVDTIQVAGLLDRRAYSLLEAGQLSEGETNAREALAIRKRLDPGGEMGIAGSQIFIAIGLTRQGKFAQAEPVLRKVLEIRERLFSPDHWLVHNTRSLLGECLLEQGRSDEAAPLLESAHEALTANAATPPARIEESAKRIERLRLARENAP